MQVDPRVIIGTAIALVIAAVVLTTHTWEIEVVETYYAEEPYSYEQELVREKQVTNWPWFWQDCTQVQYLVKNTDVAEGTFNLYFLFDDGINSRTKAKEVTIFPGEKKAVTMNSPLPDVSTVSLNVVPPNKSVAKQRTVKKTVNTWYYLPGLKFLFK